MKNIILLSSIILVLGSCSKEVYNYRTKVAVEHVAKTQRKPAPVKKTDEVAGKVQEEHIFTEASVAPGMATSATASTVATVRNHHQKSTVSAHKAKHEALARINTLKSDNLNSFNETTVAAWAPHKTLAMDSKRLIIAGLIVILIGLVVGLVANQVGWIISTVGVIILVIGLVMLLMDLL